MVISTGLLPLLTAEVMMLSSAVKLWFSIQLSLPAASSESFFSVTYVDSRIGSVLESCVSSK